MKEEYEAKVLVTNTYYDKERLRLDVEEHKEKLNVAETKTTTAADVAQTQLAMGNVAAVASGSQQRMGTGQQFAGAAAAPGAVLVPTAPGFIVHANDMSTEELVQHLLQDPSIAGITPEIAEAVAVSQMKFCQAKSTAVVAGPTGAGLPTGEAAEGHQQEMETVPPRQEDEEDPWTSDDEEYEKRLANKKGDETIEKVRVRKSVKIAKKNKVSEVNKKTK